MIPTHQLHNPPIFCEFYFNILTFSFSVRKCKHYSTLHIKTLKRPVNSVRCVVVGQEFCVPANHRFPLGDTDWTTGHTHGFQETVGGEREEGKGKVAVPIVEETSTKRTALGHEGPRRGGKGKGGQGRACSCL